MVNNNRTGVCFNGAYSLVGETDLNKIIMEININ